MSNANMSPLRSAQPAVVNLHRRAEDHLPSPLQTEVIASSTTESQHLAGEGRTHRAAMTTWPENRRRSRAQVDAELRESEMRWKFALEGAGAGVWDWEVQTGMVFFSSHYKAMLGYSEADIGNRFEDWTDYVHPGDLMAAKADIQAHFERQTDAYSNEHRLRCKDGRYKWVLARGLVVSRDADDKPLRMVGTTTDMSEIKRQQEQKQAAEIALRDALVREVHHRINNNLQGIIGILREFGCKHPQTLEPITQAVGQVQSIAVIHGLQGKKSMEQVRLCELTAAVAAGIDSLWRTSIEVHIPDPWQACLIAEHEAAPVALVLNELILNAVKHGDLTLGPLRVELRKIGEPCVARVTIINGGVWQPDKAHSQAGLQLVDALMPRHGAQLARTQQGGSVHTTLELTSPVISVENVQSP